MLTRSGLGAWAGPPVLLRADMHALPVTEEVAGTDTAVVTRWDDPDLTLVGDHPVPFRRGGEVSDSGERRQAAS